MACVLHARERLWCSSLLGVRCRDEGRRRKPLGGVLKVIQRKCATGVLIPLLLSVVRDPDRSRRREVGWPSVLLRWRQGKGATNLEAPDLLET